MTTLLRMIASNKSQLVYGLLFCLLLSACQQKENPKTKTAVFRLFDLFQPEDLAGKVNPEDAGWPRVEWRAADMTPWFPVKKSDTNSPSSALTAGPALGFRALNDLAELKTEQAQLKGNITGPTPVLQFALNKNRGGTEPVKFIEVRMNISGAKQVALRSDGNAVVEDAETVKWASQSESWTNALEVVADKLNTYRFEIQPERNPPGTNQNTGGLRHFSMAFHECKSAKFSIESVRFVSEKEEKLKEPSGQQWAGLAEIFHATLAAKTSESIRIPLRALPERARLDFAFGTKEDAPVKFKVTITNRDAAKESTADAVFERTVTIPNRWQTARIDLAGYAGKSVLIEFALTGEKKGLWGYWGSPVIRSQPGSGTSPIASGANSTKRKPRGVILLVTDTLRKDHLNIYGYPRETVIHLKKFADEGVAFSHAISQGTWTKVSVPSIVTSLYPLSSGVIDMEHALPASAKTLAEVFRDEGYATVAYSSVAFTGKMNNMHQGYDELHEASSISDRDYNAKTARHYVDRVIPWLQEHRDAPFFIFLHVFDPHSPFRPRPPYDTLWGAPGAKDRMAELDADISKQKVANKFGLPHKDEYVSKTGHDPEELLKIYTDWYDGSIRGMDAEIGRLLEALREMGLDQDTLMVWAADHGEEFWEHNELFHGQSVYGELNQVPMVYRWPNSPDIRKRIMIDHQVQNLDIMPTILELAGIKGPTNMQGRSLMPLLNGSGAATWQEQPAITQTMVDTDPPPGSASTNKAAKPHFGIIEGGLKLVRKEVDPAALHELYEHPVDSLNLTNVIKSGGPASHLGSLTNTLEAWKARARAAQLPSDDTMTQQLSSEELRRLRALGYVGGGPTRPPSTNAVPGTNAATVNTNAVKKDAGK
ncbi:MAG: sulfatase [Verrucomicrobia bacterium]|nr:sulfatase [Verrucomicrobiota bacterium]